MQLHGQTCLRFCLLLCLSRVFVAFCQDTLQSADLDASIFSGEPTSNADEKWLTDPSFSSELVGFNPDDNMLTGATDFDLWSSPVENPNGNSLASCSTPHGLGARDDVSCPVPLKDGDIPKLPQNLDDLVNMGNSPNTEPKEATPPVNEIQQFFRKDPKCPQTHPHHLCCICDGAFAFEVCQDCVGGKQHFLFTAV